MKKIVLFVATVLMIAIVALCIHIQDEDSINSVSFVVQADSDVTQSINLYNTDGKYYAFLPSYTDLDTMSVSHAAGCSLYLDGNYYSTESSLSGIIMDREYSIELKGLFGTTLCKEKLVFMKGEHVPVLSITLINGTLDDVNKSKETIKTGRAALIGADQHIDYLGDIAQFHGRGNSSWDQRKKPYALEFSEEVELLNMGRHTDYVLVANAMDESNLRNKIVYDAAQAIGLPGSVESEYVDLYVNDDYIGLYLLTNKLSLAENNPDFFDLFYETQKLNQFPLDSYETFEKVSNGIKEKGYRIENDPGNITGSYLIEFELNDRIQNESCLFTTKSGQNISVKVPKIVSEAQMDYIANYAQDLEDALGADAVLDIVDEESWSKYYLLQEVFANISRTSFFFYKNPDGQDTKLISGPIWDFDLSMGTNYDNENALPYQLYCNWGWFEKYNSNQTCMDRIKDRYQNEIRPVIEKVISTKIDEYQETIRQSYLMNEKRWTGIQHNWWVNHYETQEEHTAYLKQYLSERLKYLDHLWLGYEAPEAVLQNEAVKEQDNTSPESAPTLLERMIMLLGEENYYFKYGMLLLIGAIAVFVVTDVGKLVKTKRCCNGRKK